ncbi:MAG: N-Acetyl-D-glucosamine ABC transport system, permease protein 2, partial [uncultured Nocardioidaceae bacterium]
EPLAPVRGRPHRVRGDAVPALLHVGRRLHAAVGALRRGRAAVAAVLHHRELHPAVHAVPGGDVVHQLGDGRLDHDAALRHGQPARRLRAGQAAVPGPDADLRRGALHPHDPGAGHHAAAVPDGRRPRPLRHLLGGHPALGGDRARHLPRPAVPPRDPRRAPRRRPHRRCRAAAGVLVDRAAVVPTAHRGHGAHRVHGAVERLPVAAHHAQGPAALHAAGLAAVPAGPVRRRLRQPHGGGTADEHPARAHVRGAAAVVRPGPGPHRHQV